VQSRSLDVPRRFVPDPFVVDVPADEPTPCAPVDAGEPAAVASGPVAPDRLRSTADDHSGCRRRPWWRGTPAAVAVVAFLLGDATGAGRWPVVVVLTAVVGVVLLCPVGGAGVVYPRIGRRERPRAVTRRSEPPGCSAADGTDLDGRFDESAGPDGIAVAQDESVTADDAVCTPIYDELCSELVPVADVSGGGRELAVPPRRVGTASAGDRRPARGVSGRTSGRTVPTPLDRIMSDRLASEAAKYLRSRTANCDWLDHSVADIRKSLERPAAGPGGLAVVPAGDGTAAHWDFDHLVQSLDRAARRRRGLCPPPAGDDVPADRCHDGTRSSWFMFVVTSGDPVRDAERVTEQWFVWASDDTWAIARQDAAGRTVVTTYLSDQRAHRAAFTSCVRQLSQACDDVDRPVAVVQDNGGTVVVVGDRPGGRGATGDRRPTRRSAQAPTTRKKVRRRRFESVCSRWGLVVVVHLGLVPLASTVLTMFGTGVEDPVQADRPAVERPSTGPTS
jgi:hypothetical protein